MTHDPREALEIVQQMIRGEPMSAWITDTRTMKSLGDVVDARRPLRGEAVM